MTENIIYDDEGRLRGAYIYMLLCQDDDGPVYVKLGMSSCPTRRLHEIRLGCPVTPRQFCTIRQPSRSKAFRAETALHKALRQWRSSGEWYLVRMADKAAYNAALRTALLPFKKIGYPITWQRVEVQPIVKIRERNKRWAQKIWVRGGNARRDFLTASR